ncbi:MAG: hypothetical protein P1P64_08615 [Treponemataceae bacterium]
MQENKKKNKIETTGVKAIKAPAFLKSLAIKNKQEGKIKKWNFAE